MRQSSQLHTLANLAKQRLKSGNYKNITTTCKNSFSSAVSASTYFLCNARALKKEYIKAKIVSINLHNAEFENKVIDLLKSNDMLFNPLGILADSNLLSSLDDLSKQQYILKLSEEFNKIKNDYLNQKIA